MDDCNLLAQLSKTLPTLNKSEVKVANVVLRDPEAATRSSIAALARAADVSEPSVNRFCKRFGASGFPDFKLKLARSLVSGVQYISSAVELDDDIETYPRKLFDNTIASLIMARDSLPLEDIQAAVAHLANARRIHFFGLGTSAAVAKDAEHKFFRFRIPVSSHTDPLMLRMLASSGEARDVFFCISYTGRTRPIVEAAALAHNTDATVIALTQRDSPLAQQSHCVIGLDNEENTDQYLPMTSRIIQLVILDVLATGLILAKGEGLLPHLARIKSSLRDTRIPDQSA